MSDSEHLRETLAKIAEIASAATNGNSYHKDNYEGGEEGQHSHDYSYGCTIKTLPTELLEDAARTAAEINPINAPGLGPVAAIGGDSSLVSEPLRIAVSTSKYWGPRPRRLSVSFMETTPSDLRARIISHLNAWSRTGGITFAETQGVGEVRISRGGGGFWSYLGTDVLLIPTNRQTMNLQGFTMNTPESEFRRVVRHEAGHTLGCPHEHMRRELVDRLDREKTYAYFRRTQGWDRATVDQQVLTPLDDRAILGTPADQDSIMCYQLPGEITRDGLPIRGGRDINQTDFDFIGRIYPRVVAAPQPTHYSPERAASAYQQSPEQAGELNFDFEYTS
jgi:hypothetical protein